MAALASIVDVVAGAGDGVADDEDVANADVGDMVDSCLCNFEFRNAAVKEQQARMIRPQIQQDKLRMKPE